MRKIRRAHKRNAEAVRSVRWLLLRLAGQGKRLSIEDGVSPIPKERAVRLAGIEPAKVSAAAAESAAPSSATKTATAKTTATAEASAKCFTEAAAPAAKPSTTWATEESTGAGHLSAVLCTVTFERITQTVEVYTGHWAHLPRLSGDRNRFAAEICISGDGGQIGTACAGCSVSRLGAFSERIHEAQALRRIPGQLANCLFFKTLLASLPSSLSSSRSSMSCLLTFLFRSARGKDELKVHCAVVIGGIQHGFLRARRKSRKLRANHV